MENTTRAVYVVDGARTPFLKVQGEPNPLSAADLAIAAIRPLLLRQSFSPDKIEEVITGCVAPSADEVNIARIIALRAGLGDHVMGWTVQRNCASGLQAIDNAVCDIENGRHDLILAGGTESMSRAPVLFNDDMVQWLARFNKSKSTFKKLGELLKFRPHFLTPVIGLLKGLNDPIVNLSMGQTAEKLAYLFNISREEMDEYATLSQVRAKEASALGHFEEITPLYDYRGHFIPNDTGLRETTVAKLATLKPAFDKPFGLVTAGNSSQVSDGAAFVILASREAVKKYSLPVLGRVIKTSWAALNPSVMGLGPVHAIAKLLSKMQLNVEDIDYWEINEAFAAQVLACLRAMQDEEYCKKYLNLNKPLGKIDLAKLNVEGGAIALGHPVGASGARLVLHLLHLLKRRNAQRGIASLCIGGGQGGAMLLENIEGVI